MGPDSFGITVVRSAATTATGSGLVSVYSPRFTAGAEHLGTCVVEPASADCSYTVQQASGSIELIATAATGSALTGWGAGCTQEVGNACLVEFDAPGSDSIEVAFSLVTVPVKVEVSVAPDTIDIHGTGPAGVLRSNHGHVLSFSSGVVTFWDFEVPPTGLDVTLTVEPSSGNVVRYIYGFLTLLTHNVIVCGAVDFVASCTFSMRPNELPPGPVLGLAIKLEPPPPPPPPPPGGVQRYVATNGRDGSNACTDFNDPCLTIQHAVNAATAGDLITVASGPYVGVVNVSKAVELRGTRGSTVLSGQFAIGDGVAQNLTGDALISGFTIAPGAGADTGIRVGPLAIGNVEISQVDVSGFDRGIAANLSGGDLSITDATIQNNADDGIHIQGRGDVTLRSVDVIGNGADGIQFSGVGSAGSATLISIADAVIENSGQAGVQVETMEGGSFSMVRSCISGNGRDALQDPNLGQAGVTLSDLSGVSFPANGNNITGNHAGGISVASSSPAPNFRNNWWGTPAGPTGTNGATGTVDVSSPAPAPIPGTPCS
jgi:hypothetical protein